MSTPSGSKSRKFWIAAIVSAVIVVLLALADHYGAFPTVVETQKGRLDTRNDREFKKGTRDLNKIPDFKDAAERLAQEETIHARNNELVHDYRKDCPGDSHWDDEKLKRVKTMILTNCKVGEGFMVKLADSYKVEEYFVGLYKFADPSLPLVTDVENQVGKPLLAQVAEAHLYSPTHVAEKVGDNLWKLGGKVFLVPEGKADVIAFMRKEEAP